MNDNIKNVILSDSRMKRLFENIMKKDQYYWKKFGIPDEIFRWLNNFNNKTEIYYALILGDSITYYNAEDVKYLWRLVLNNKVKRHICETFLSGKDLDTPKKFNTSFINFIKQRCLFIGFGEIYTSGSHMVYPFQQAISPIISPKDIQFMNYSDFLSAKKDLKKVKMIILLDDFIGTGKQAIDEWKDKIVKSKIYKRNRHIEYLYLALTGFLLGVNNIENKTKMKVILGNPPMEDNCRCFSPSSDIYKDPADRRSAKLIMEKLGKMLSEYPLGYENDQAAVALYHNTPNNTLPVIWKRMDDGSWYPLFERFE